MYAWIQYKRLNENRNLSESVVLKKYYNYLSRIDLERAMRESSEGGGGIDVSVDVPITFLLQEDGFNILQEDNNKIIIT